MAAMELNISRQQEGKVAGEGVEERVLSPPITALRVRDEHTKERNIAVVVWGGRGLESNTKVEQGADVMGYHPPVFDLHVGEIDLSAFVLYTPGRSRNTLQNTSYPANPSSASCLSSTAPPIMVLHKRSSIHAVCVNDENQQK
jgi:hypothetical protein